LVRGLVTNYHRSGDLHQFIVYNHSSNPLTLIFFPCLCSTKGGKAAVGVAHGFEAMASPTAKIEDVQLRLVAYIQTQR